MKEFIKYQKNRGLDKNPFVSLNESANIVEELLEMNGYNVPKENRQALAHRFDMFMSRMLEAGISEKDKKFHPIYSPLDAMSDIKNFCDGGQLKLGYDPDKCDMQCAKEVHSRIGKIENGKFEKDLSPMAVSMWYQADYSLCILPKEELKTETHNDGYNENKTADMLNNEVHVSSMLDDIAFQEDAMVNHDESRK